MPPDQRYLDHNIESMRWGQLQKLQLDRLTAFLARHVQDNPWFRAFYGTANRDVRSIRSLEEFRELPVMRKSDVLRDIQKHPPFGQRCAVAPEDIRMIVETSGTTAAISERYAMNEADIAGTLALERFGFHWAGFGPGVTVAVTGPVTTKAAGQWYYEAMRSLGASLLNIATYDTQRRLGYLEEFKPEILIAHPSYLMRLEHVLAESGKEPRELGIRRILCAGEAYSLKWAQARENIWNAKLFEQYGSTQRAIAWSCELGVCHDGHLGVLHTLPHLALYEVVDPVTGQPVAENEAGELIITPFSATTASPIVRFATGDRVVNVPPGGCECGRHFAGFRAGSTERFDNMVKLRGVNVFQSAIDDIVLNPPVLEYQGRIFTSASGTEEAEIAVELNRSDSSGADIIQDIEHRLRTALNLRFSVVLHTGAPLGAKADSQIDVTKRRRLLDERDTT